MILLDAVAHPAQDLAQAVQRQKTDEEDDVKGENPYMALKL